MASEQSGQVCVCGHPFDRHVVMVWPLRDPCAGGTPGFCGCTGYRPVAPSEPPAADSPTPGTEACPSCGSALASDGGCLRRSCQFLAAPSPVDTAKPGVAVCFCRDGVIPHEPGSEGCRDTEPPAETQQDDEQGVQVTDEHRRLARAAVAALQGGAHGPISQAIADAEQRGYETAALAARPSADTETLADRFISGALDNIGAFDGSNDEARDRADVRAQLIALLDGFR